tara:strand:- start:30 stop:500 length:471 start_codon:yes stop_codon:yes gene_type:complete
MRNLAILLFLFGILSVNLSLGQDVDDILIWGERDLEWTDFSGPIDQESHHEASTRSQLRTPTSWNSDSITGIITAEFIKSKSWVKGTPSDLLLKHEQLHFDITKYHARMFRKTVANHRFKSYENMTQEVTELFNERFQMYEAMQNLYDQDVVLQLK